VNRYTYSGGSKQGWSRESLRTGNLRPGETGEVEFYPRGQLRGITEITVEIETRVPADGERFFKELQNVR